MVGLTEILSRFEIILASGSPRRAELLDHAGIPFKRIQLDVEETYPLDLPPIEVASFLAKKKASAVMDQLKEGQIAITADTIVIHNDTILGKPESSSEAKQTLASLSDQTHEVVTGVSLTSLKRQITFMSVSMVRFGKMTNDEIDQYVYSAKPMDKAGSYAIQEWIGHCRIAWIQGSYTNIVGLPMYELYEALSQFMEPS